MRLTTRTNLAMRTLMFCAVNDGRVVRKHEVAEACNGSENHLAQVIHLLAQHGFLRTVRGRSGGLQLGRSVDDIRVGEVFRTFEAAYRLRNALTAKRTMLPACRLLPTEMCAQRSAERLLCHLTVSRCATWSKATTNWTPC